MLQSIKQNKYEVRGSKIKMYTVYFERCHQFFPEIDDKNCERNYKEIIGLLERK